MRQMARFMVWMGLFLVLGCSNYRSMREAQLAEQDGDWDRAVLEYMELINRHPDDLRYRTGLMRAKIQASHEHFERAKRYADAGLYSQAMVELQQAVQLDPTNQYALAELDKVRIALEEQRSGEEGRNIDEMKQRARESTEGKPPVLNPRSKEPIDLDFPEPVSVMKIYQALGKAFGINVLFEPKLRDQEITISLKEVTAQDALEILMRTAGHFYKVIDEHSILVIADTPQNRRTYEDLIIQTFFLSNSDVRDVMTMLRSLVDARKIAANESLNAIILRDTADKVKVAERIILANDKSKAEVVVEVELLQINTNKLQDLGVSLDNYSIGVSLDNGGEDVALRVSDLEFLNQNNWVVTVPSFLFSFIKNATEAQVLARPQLRISEGERARLNIGERVPIPVTSFNTANTVGGNIVPITSFQYQDVGIQIEIEPRVHHNEEISMQVDVEVSNISGNIGDQPIIGTRNITTTIRLRDGETNFLAGLLRSDEINSEDSIPGLGDIPVIGRLFSKKRTETQRTDLVLTLTPHLIRRADITEEDLRPIWVGTESNITFSGGSPRVESNVEGPFDQPENVPQDAQEEMRRRIQRLPRGLQGQQGQEAPAEEQPQTPPGVELVPSSAPSPFGRQRPEPEPQEEEPPGMVDLGTGAEPDSRIPPPAETSVQAELAASIPAAVAVDATGFAADALAARADLGEPPGGIEADVLLELLPAEATVDVGELFEVRLDVSTTTPVSHFPIVLGFDPAVLEVVQVRRGDFLGGPTDAHVLSDFSRAGRLVLGASRLGDVAGVQGVGTVLYVTFKALGTGISDLEFLEAEALDEELVVRSRMRAEPSQIRVFPDLGGVPKPPKGAGGEV